MSVWFAIPSKKSAAECNKTVALWQSRGYKVSVLRDVGDEANVFADMVLGEEYRGYASAVNQLCFALKIIPDIEWIITGGDDVSPDPNHSPEQISTECTAHFNGTLGIMEPTGDRWMVDASGRCAAERVCVAPWLGREWIERGYEGHGPLCEAYHHFFVDEDLKNVTEKLGILWHRPDLIHYHAHWSRAGQERPKYLERASTEWAKSKELFESRREAGFPGSGLLPLVEA